MGKPKIIGCDEDGKALYEPRPFHAEQNGGTLQIHCKRCKTTTWTSSRYPHDVASRHRCLYDPKDIEDAAS
jgi:hypothetical protein